MEPEDLNIPAAETVLGIWAISAVDPVAVYEDAIRAIVFLAIETLVLAEIIDIAVQA